MLGKRLWRCNFICTNRHEAQNVILPSACIVVKFINKIVFIYLICGEEKSITVHLYVNISLFLFQKSKLKKQRLLLFHLNMRITWPATHQKLWAQPQLLYLLATQVRHKYIFSWCEYTVMWTVHVCPGSTDGSSLSLHSTSGINY